MTTAGCLSSDEEEDGETNSSTNGNGDSTTDPAEDLGFEGQMTAVMDALSDYHDPKVALEDGYILTGPYVPGMGWQFLNEDLLDDAVENGLDIEKPQMLCYLETDEGLKLGAAEYAIPSDEVDETPNLFADEGQSHIAVPEAEGWETVEAATKVYALESHSEYDIETVDLDYLRKKDRWAKFQSDHDLSEGDRTVLEWGGESLPPDEMGDEEAEEYEVRRIDAMWDLPELETLRVWTEEDNPDGMFTPMNPRFMD